MPDDLPHFKYHPDPLRSGVIVASDVACICCGDVRGLIYVGPAYTTHRQVENRICPWCIADGSAARKFDVEFADACVLLKAGVAREIVEEVTRRTPGYESWQQDEWRSHCGDACAFIGDAEIADVAFASRATIDAWKSHYGMSEADWKSIAHCYEPCVHSSVYKCACRHCNAVLFSWDSH